MTATPRASDILVAGGSFAGLAFALSVAHESGGDLAVTVVSPDFPDLDLHPADIRASALSRGSLHLLEHLGLWSELSPHAQPVDTIEITDSDLHDAIRQTRFTYDLASPSPLTSDRSDALAEAPHLPRMVIIENHILGAALHRAARAAAGIELIAGTAIDDFTTGLDHVVARLADSRTLTARLLVAADGSRSRLRECASIRTVGHPYEQSGIIAIVEPELPHGGRATQHFLPAGPFALLPMTHDRICITWTETATETRRILALDPHAFRGEIEKRFGNRLGALKSISTPRSWPLTLAVARDLVADRFALVGDAAHAVHPIAGQGLNLGLRDVAALAEIVIDTARLGLDFGQASVLESYQRQRRFDNLASAVGFDSVNRVFSSSSTLVRSARGAVLGIADSLPSLKSWLMDEASGDAGQRPRLMR